MSTGSVVCLNCGQTFEQVLGRGRPRVRCYACSPRTVLQPGAYRKFEPVSRVCADPECGRDFLATWATARYCGRSCGVRHKNRKAHERWRAENPRACPTCRVVFTCGTPGVGWRFCSVECKRKSDADRKGGNGHKRRAKKFGVVYGFVNKWRVFERDGWRCKLCGVRTPRRLSGTTRPNAPQLDHIVPLSQGGDHVETNVQCACRRCNYAKGAQARGQLLLAI